MTSAGSQLSPTLLRCPMSVQPQSVPTGPAEPRELGERPADSTHAESSHEHGGPGVSYTLPATG